MPTIIIHSLSPAFLRPTLLPSLSLPINSSYFPISSVDSGCRKSVRVLPHKGERRRLSGAVMAFLPENEVVYDVCVSAFASGVALTLLRFWEEMAKLGVERLTRDATDIAEEKPSATVLVKLNRKLVHISIGMAFMLFWPLFSSGIQAPFLAALAPAINIIRMLSIGLGIVTNKAVIQSMTRGGDHRELLKGPLYYACTITLSTILYWRTSPIGIAAICNLCAGDGIADIVGRRLGKQKLPYNSDKSFAGSIAMAVAGFSASIMYMHYFSLFGFIEESWDMVLGFLVVSLAAAVIESLPISSKLDDNLTVPLTSLLVGSCVF